jgi:hypothetical protein
VRSESLEVQGSLVAAVESLRLVEVSSIALGEVTGLCA